MFPGGMSPEQRRLLEERTKAARHLEPHFRSAQEGLMQNQNAIRLAQESAEKQAERLRAGARIPLALSAETMVSLRSAEAMLNSLGFRGRVEEVRRANDLAYRRFGSEGVKASQQIAARYLEENRAFEEGFERAAERIQDGHADEILSEAAALASSPEAYQAMERADKDMLLRLAQQQAEQSGEDPETTIQAGVDVETVIASAKPLTKEEYLTLEYYALQLARILFVLVSAAAVISASVLLAQASLALGGVIAVLEVLKATREKESSA